MLSLRGYVRKQIKFGEYMHNLSNDVYWQGFVAALESLEEYLK